ncbi:Oidioi.mRNA.OKI2018_I69.chr1.g1785.t1.cds [Oikopleura dioica]|uniref:Oidioi.mRNA.OKI2018_I69.chr1.g1785.t1.cds n=1 Tax=Oikopleura dioica TaxID=34765 RepID=A0ABN7ST77_OIKDI|nr:Oidioi.mRNA.OKI2018_I69.chr1.g1785.t1.cds [Oikopleura dioica]
MGDQVSERKLDLTSWQENWANSADFQFGLAELNNVVAREELLRIAAARLQTKLEAPSGDEENGAAGPKAGRQRPPKIEAEIAQLLPCIGETKETIRNEIWDQLDINNLVRFPRPCHGRIPNFQGHQRAANRLSKCKEYLEARTITVNENDAQEKVRYLSLWDRKVLLVPASLEEGLMWEIDGNDITDKKCKQAASKRGLASAQFGGDRPKRLRDLKGKHLDLVVIGSVCVCPRTGLRLGKGTGLTDLEWGMLFELGVVDEHTTVATTVHDLQVKPLPGFLKTEHDVTVDIICTPTKTIRVRNRKPRATGINWHELPEHFGELPPVRDLRRAKQLKERRISEMNQSQSGSSASCSANGSLNGNDAVDVNNHDIDSF